MKTILRSFLLLITLAVFATCKRDPFLASYKAQNVIVIVVDGPRWSETWGDSAGRLIPFRRDSLKPKGVYFSDFRNDNFTYTNSGHTSLCTGHSQSINNSGAELPQHPSFMQYWLKASGMPSEKAWVISSKDKLAVLADCNDSEWHQHYNPKTNCGNNGLGTGYCHDTLTLKRILQTLDNHHPRVMVINFKEPDASGHSGNWNNYINGIRQTDQYIQQIWNKIQSDPVYAGKTALFITNDHGRHLDGVADGFISHGDNCEGCKHIELLAVGPDFKAGTTVSTRYEQQDLAQSIAEMIGVALKGVEGKSIPELVRK